MRWCLLLLAGGFIAEGLYGTARVVVSSKLQGTLAGKIVERRLAGYVGREVEFRVRHGVKNRFYTGTISQMIVPNITTYVDSGDQNDARFRAKLTNVAPKDPQDDTNPLPSEAQLKNIDIFGHSPGGGRVGHVQYLNSAMLGEGLSMSVARLLAKYTDDNGEEYWEALMELKTPTEGVIKIELENPFIVMLSAEEDFMKFFPLPLPTP